VLFACWVAVMRPSARKRSRATGRCGLSSRTSSATENDTSAPAAATSAMPMWATERPGPSQSGRAPAPPHHSTQPTATAAQPTRTWPDACHATAKAMPAAAAAATTPGARADQPPSSAARTTTSTLDTIPTQPNRAQMDWTESASQAVKWSRRSGWSSSLPGSPAISGAPDPDSRPPVAMVRSMPLLVGHVQ